MNFTLFTAPDALPEPRPTQPIVVALPLATVEDLLT
jgi:hypothetical protein